MEDFQVVWRGPLFDASGYGRASREYVSALFQQGVDVKIEIWSWRYRIRELEKDKKEWLANLQAKPDAAGKPKVLIYHSPPLHIDLDKERKRFDRVILNTAWETTQLPEKWVPAINKFDAVCIPSSYCVKAMIDSGVKIPLFLVPHGVNCKEFKPQDKKPLLKQADRKFVFLSIFEFQHRKNPEALLRAYWEEFSDKDNVVLIIKTHWERRSRKAVKAKMLEYQGKLRLTHKTAPLIIITGSLKDEDLLGLYRLGSVFVLPSRGEGVGLPYMEALASGLPAIATGWGGQMDFLTENNAFLVNYKLENPERTMNSKNIISPAWRQLFAEKGQLWAEVDIDDLKTKMREAYENPEICWQKGKQGRKDMLAFSWEKAGSALKQAIEKVILSS